MLPANTALAIQRRTVRALIQASSIDGALFGIRAQERAKIITRCYAQRASRQRRCDAMPLPCSARRNLEARRRSGLLHQFHSSSSLASIARAIIVSARLTTRPRVTLAV